MEKPWFCMRLPSNLPSNHGETMVNHGFTMLTMVKPWLNPDHHGKTMVFHGLTIKFSIKPWLNHDYHGKNHGFFMVLPQ